MKSDVRTTSTTESEVYNRYASAAQSVEPALCCPVEYSQDLLQVIPDEIIEKDYGCGDPTPYVKPGDTVLDLGAGGGKLCFIASQLVGETGRVIGVDCNQEMLALARKHTPTVAERIGYSNVDFRYGLIQDLALDLQALENGLAESPVRNANDYLALRNLEDRLRQEQPLVESNSVDCVLSNCVLNLVRQQDRTQLFREIFRVLKNGGRAAISDIVSDEDVPEPLQQDGTLWSGCISGAFREDKFVDAFREAGFVGMQIVKRQVEPWQVVEGIEFRSMTIVAYKMEGPCLDRNQALVYAGPFKTVYDDDGHVFHRGQRIAVCEKLFQRYQKEPYADMFYPLQPRVSVPPEEAKMFDCHGGTLRSAREMKGHNYLQTIASTDECCGPDGCC
ncbi:MAG: methyltransferase domain-containing protein [Planctomycetales bacterium]|nr:methyltransferase domain-containing protein [Planctomycetales bacterium]